MTTTIPSTMTTTTTCVTPGCGNAPAGPGFGGRCFTHRFASSSTQQSARWAGMTAGLVEFVPAFATAVKEEVRANPQIHPFFSHLAKNSRPEVKKDYTPSPEIQASLDALSVTLKEAWKEVEAKKTRKKKNV